MMKSQEEPGNLGGNMTRSVIKAIGLILLGVILCIATQIGIVAYNAYHAYHMMSSDLGRPYPGSMSKKDIQAWYDVDKALKDCDVKAVNDILSVKPGEIELTVMMCPLYPEGCTPIAEISLKNVSKRELVIFEPAVTRMTGASYESGGRLTDMFDVSCGISSGTRWCRVLAPRQVLALPLEKLEVNGSGLHRVNFRVGFPDYEFISIRTSKYNLPTVSETSCVFDLKWDRPSKVNPSEASVVSTNGCITHVVERNQDVQAVAMMYGVDVKTLKKFNGLEGNDLRVGQELKIPEPK